MTTSKRRVLTYARQSQARQGEDETTALSLEAQEAAIQRYCAERGMQIVGNVRDHDLSGEDWDRPGIKELLAQSVAGKVDAVVVFKLSRFARDALYQELTHRELKKRGVELFSVTEAGIEKTLIRMVYAGMAQQSNEDVSEFLKNSLASRANRGLHHGRPPYGYFVPSGTDRTNRRLEPHPVEAPVVQRIFAMRAAGLGPIAIANRLNGEGIRAKGGGSWWSSAIRNVLKVPTYAGYAVYQGEIVGDLDPTNTPAIIDRVLWHQVQNLWAGGRAPGVHESRMTWVQGLVYHTCGKKMWFTQQSKERNGYTRRASMQCADKARDRSHRCTEPGAAIRVRALEEASQLCLSRDLAAIPRTLDAAIAAYMVSLGKPDAVTRLAELERQRDHVRASIKRAEQLVVNGYRDEEWFAEQDAPMQAELRQIAKDIAALRDVPSAKSLAPYHDRLKHLDSAMDLLSDEKRFEIVSSLGKIVAGHTVQIQYRDEYRAFFPNPTVIRYIYHPGKNVYRYETV